MRKFFAKCAQIEETIADVYRVLSEVVPEDHGLARIWREMAKEENDHAMQLRFAARLPEEETVVASRLPGETVEQLLSRARDLLLGAKGRTLSLEEALRLSLQMERDFGCVHAHCAAEFVDERMAGMFRALAWDDDRHAELLQKYCRSIGLEIAGDAK